MKIRMSLLCCACVVLISVFELPVAQAGPGGFVYTGSMSTPREDHTATVFNNGMVLIAGGANSGGALSSAELYNPATGAFSPTGSMHTARYYYAATLLHNGKVLITGGYGVNGELSSAEIYDPATGAFAVTGNMAAARGHHTATLLNNGMVLVAGGAGNGGTALSSAEVYNPATGTFSSTGSLHNARHDHTATLLDDGTVLLAGGFNGSIFLASAELYNSGTGTFTVTGSLNVAREAPTATLLNNGTVLIAGGSNANAISLSTAELYSPSARTFSFTGSMNAARADHVATLLNNGTVLVVGGYCYSGCGSGSVALSSAELYDPSAGTFSYTGSMNTPRYGWATASLLTNGEVLVTGGYSGSAVLSSAELYQPTTPTDGLNFAAGTSTTISTSVTPTLGNDFAVVVLGTQSSIGQTSPILPPGYTSISADGHTTIAYRQLTSTATETPSKAINSAEWAEGLVLLVTKTGSSAAFRSTSMHEVSGSISAPSQTLVPASPYLAGSTVLVCLRASRINTTGGPPTITKITDTQSNTYVKFGAVAIGGGAGGADGAAVEIWGATNVAGGTPTITVQIGGTGGWSGTLGAYEFTGVL